MPKWVRFILSLWKPVAAVLTFLFGLAGFAFGLYTIIHTRQPALKIEILNDFNVLDVREPLRGLRVFFEDQDIQQRNLNLRIYRLEVVNNGETDILQSSYDTNQPFGLEIDNARIFDVTLVDASNYIRDQLDPTILTESRIIFNKVILDKGAVFIIDIVVLHSRDTDPILTPLGKIAGIDRIDVVRRPPPGIQQPLIQDIVYGSLVVHIARFILYLLSFLLIVGILVIVAVVISEALEKRGRSSRARNVEPLLSIQNIEKDSPGYVPLSLFINYGQMAIDSIDELISNPEKTARQYTDHRSFMSRRLRDLRKSKTSELTAEWQVVPSHHLLAVRIRNGPVVFELFESDVITRNPDRSLHWDENFIESFEKLKAYLLSRG